MVLKIKPNWLVQPWTGHQSGPVIIKNRKPKKNKKLPIQPKKPGTAMVKPVLESEGE